MQSNLHDLGELSDRLHIEKMAVQLLLVFLVEKTVKPLRWGEHLAFGKGKKNNVTATLPKKRRVDAPGPKPGLRDVKGGSGRGAGRGKRAAQEAAGVKTTVTRKAGPKKTRRGTTSRPGER